MFLVFTTFGSLSFDQVFSQAKSMPVGDPALVAITLLLFIAVGKSAQIPLYTWLPDAMAGPTPVSALIHAATMVTAGVYMVARSNILYALSPATMAVIGVTGLATALFAASIAIFQNDIKKSLPIPPSAKLGYMFIGLSVGAFTGAMFHLHHPRLFQGAALPGCRERDPCPGRGTGYLQHGRTAEQVAQDLLDLPHCHPGHRRDPAIVGILLQG